MKRALAVNVLRWRLRTVGQTGWRATHCLTKAAKQHGPSCWWPPSLFGRHTKCATPERPATNGVVELAVRSVLHGSLAALLHAGFPESFWPFAVQHWCFAHNIAIDERGDSPWNRQLKQGGFKGTNGYPLGALSTSCRHQSRAGHPSFTQHSTWCPLGLSGAAAGGASTVRLR